MFMVFAFDGCKLGLEHALECPLLMSLRKLGDGASKLRYHLFIWLGCAFSRISGEVVAPHSGLTSSIRRNKFVFSGSLAVDVNCRKVLE